MARCECGCGGTTSARYRTGHHSRKSPVAFVVDAESGCWNWQRGLNGGYGAMKVAQRQSYAHRVYYERLVGPIPDDLVIDHLCRNKACVNPAHMEVVTGRVNTQRAPVPSSTKAMACWRTWHATAVWAMDPRCGLTRLDGSHRPAFDVVAKASK